MDTQTNPYSTGTITAPINHDMDPGPQIKKYRDEERLQKAPKVQPFNFDASREVLSSIYESLLKMRKMIKQAEQNTQINKTTLHNISMIVDNIGEEVLVKIPEQLDKLNL